MRYLCLTSLPPRPPFNSAASLQGGLSLSKSMLISTFKLLFAKWQRCDVELQLLSLDWSLPVWRLKLIWINSMTLKAGMGYPGPSQSTWRSILKCVLMQLNMHLYKNHFSVFQSAFVADILLWLRRAAVDYRTSGSSNTARADCHNGRGRAFHINLRGCHTSPPAGQTQHFLLQRNIKAWAELTSISLWSWSWTTMPLGGQKRNRLTYRVGVFFVFFYMKMYIDFKNVVFLDSCSAAISI